MHGLTQRLRRTRRRERGIALLVVLSTLTLLTAIVAQFQFNAQVDIQLAYNGRDALQAEYNALSALRLRALILRHGRRLNSAMEQLGSAVGMESGAMPPLGQIIEMVPVDCGLLSAVFKEVGGELADEDDEGGLDDFFPGECSATSESEHAKISLNVLAKPTGNADQHTGQLLLGLLSNPALERHFQEDDRNGTHAESPMELVAALTDWIDRDKNQTGNQVVDEDRYYANLRDSYEVKNAPYDSLAEIQLVHGIDDELYDLFKDNVTIYSDSSQIELATAPIERIWIGLLGSMREGVSAEELLMHPGVGQLQQLLTEMRMLGGTGFSILKVAGLVGLIQTVGLDSYIDPTAVRQVFTDRQGTTWYTIHAQGRVGNASRRIKAVFQASEGQFYYVRVE